MTKFFAAAFAVSFVLLGAGCGGSKSTDDAQVADETKSERTKNISEMAEKAGVAVPEGQNQPANTEGQ